MSDADWLTTGQMRELVGRIVEKAARTYRIQPEAAERIVLEALGETTPVNAALKDMVDRGRDAVSIARSRAFKRAASAARARVYYSLRRYRPDESQVEADVAALASLPDGAPADLREDAARRLLLDFAGTRERSGHEHVFYERLFALAGGPGTVRTVLDVGCGVFPLSFPFDGAGRSVEVYAACDRDETAVRAVGEYARLRPCRVTSSFNRDGQDGQDCRRSPSRESCASLLDSGRLRPLVWDIAAGWAPVREASGVETFDLALLLKLVPVVARQAPKLLEVLAATPARRMLVTGSRESMTKRRSIERRERAVIRRFIESSGLTTVGEFETEDETGWMVERAVLKTST